jgi:hypothetical protein
LQESANAAVTFQLRKVRRVHTFTQCYLPCYYHVLSGTTISGYLILSNVFEWIAGEGCVC